jgi:hypothetical protein
MPKNDVTSRVELLVGLDKQSYRRTRAQLDALYTDRVEIGVDEGSIKDFSRQLQKLSKESGSQMSRVMANRFDQTIGNYLTEFGTVNKDLQEAMSENNEERIEELILRRDTIKDQFEQEIELQKKRTESLKDLDKLLRPDLDAYKEAGEAVGSSAKDFLDNVKSGDLKGFAAALSGGVIASLKDLQKLRSLQAASTGDADQAKQLAASAASLGKATLALTAVGASLVAAVALFVAADEQARDLNKSMLEGASIADFAYKNQVGLIGDMTTSLTAARKAASAVSFETRGTVEEMAEVLSQLNQAGFSYEEMAKSAGKGKSETAAFAETIRKTFSYSQALGLSISEVAEASATWSTQFGSDLEQIGENFAVIQKYALESGFNTKRFFSAVSQATAGMAIYNARVEEAAFLLQKTQKILGDTDASDFIRSLTQGFADESITDRMKRIMIAGGKDTADIFKGTAERTARSFVETFQGGPTQDAISKAFESVGLEATIFGKDGAAQLQQKWGELSERDRRLTIARLRENNDEQSDAAARQLETLGSLVDGVNQGFGAQVRGLAALDMQGKLAYKLQTLGDKRLNDMSAVELAAFESYAGISGSQLEQLMRVENQLLADYELAKVNGEAAGKSFDEWIATNQDASKQLDNIGEIEDQASYFSRKNVENTRSVLNVLKNTISMILNNIYTLMTDWYLDTKGLTKESLDKQAEALAEIRKQRDANAHELESLDDKLAALDKTISTTGASSEEHQTALAEKAKVVAEQQRLAMQGSFLKAQEREVMKLDEDTLSGAGGTQDVLGEASVALVEAGKDLDIAAEHMSEADFAAFLKERGTAGAQASNIYPHLDPLTMGGAALYEQITPVNAVGDMLGVDFVGPMEALHDASLAQANVLQESFKENNQNGEEAAGSLAALVEGGVKSQRQAMESMQSDKAWKESGFYNEARDSSLEALKKYEAWKLALQVGLSDDRLEQAMAEFASGDTARGRGILASALSANGINPFEKTTPSAQDFVMRPGQPAQRFNPSDTIVGVKAGGPVATPTATTVVNHFNISGSPAEVYRGVQAALRNSGLRP